MKHNKNNDQESNNSQYMPLCMCIGISVGGAIGTALDHIAIGMCMGLSVGVCFGVTIDSMRKKKAEDTSEDNDKKNNFENE